MAAAAEGHCHRCRRFGADERGGCVRLRHAAGEGAKAPVWRADGRGVLLVVQADRRLGKCAFQGAHGVKNRRIRSVDGFQGLTSLEPGEAPPFAHHLGLPSYADEGLLALTGIVLNADSRGTSVPLATADYVRLEHPTAGRFATDA